MSDLDPTPPSDDLARIVGDDADAVKNSASAQRVELLRQQDALNSKMAAAREELDRQRRELEADFERRQAELLAQIAPLKKHLDQMREVMWTVDLYLGRDETLQLVRDGESAPADTPISVRQRVLVMAEESLLLMGRSETGMDAQDVPEFVNWLLEDDANLNRVLPDLKGVVVLIPTRVQSRTGDFFEDIARDSDNQRSYWLIRNGDRLYVLTVDPELRVTERLLPLRTEFSEVFTRRLWHHGRSHEEPVRPGSQEWIEMEQIAGARQRHYMRIMLVLQGLIDRTPVWHPLPEWGASFMSLADHESGKIVLIQDGDNALQLGDGHESFADYQKRLNAQLRPGLRIVGTWGSGFRDWYDSELGKHERLRPAATNDYPEEATPYLLRERRNGYLTFSYPRREKVWKKNVPIPDEPGYVWGSALVDPNSNITCKVSTRDNWVLPVDLTTREELRYFLNSRDERSKHFLTMAPVIRAALAVKDAESETEAPFRGLLAQLLVQEGASIGEADTHVESLVHWWKLANTYTRPLNGAPPWENKAARQIVDEYRRRRTHAKDDSQGAMIEAAQAIPGVIAVARDRQGLWNAYAPSTPAHDSGVFLDVTRIRKDGTLGATKTEQIVPRRTASTLDVAWSAEAWTTWKFGANRNHYLTSPERQALVDHLKATADGTPLCVVEYFDEREPSERMMAIYSWTSETAPGEMTGTANPDLLDSRGPSGLVSVRSISITKKGQTVTRGSSNPYRFSYFFGVFSGRGALAETSAVARWGSIPWWPDDAYRYDDMRPRLVWADEALLDDLADFRNRCTAAWEEERAASVARDNEIRRLYVTPILAAAEAIRVAEVRKRFLEDFGHNSDDLWDAHLKSLPTPKTLSSHDLFSVVSVALDHGEPVAGRTLASLADAAHARSAAEKRWPPARRMDVLTFGAVVVPEPEEGEAGTDRAD